MDPSTLSQIAWEDLMVLLAAADSGSLSGAARTLRIGQSTASRRLARLERTLGSRLFERRPEGLQPTVLTSALLPRVRLMEGQMAELARLAAGQEMAPAGRVRLALPDGLASMALMAHLPAFFARYPEVDLDLRIGPAMLDLVRGQADIALRFAPSTGSDLIELPMGRMELAPYAHPRWAGQPLAALRWVMLTDPSHAFQETRWIERHAGARVPRLEVSLWNALYAAVRSGVGAGLLSPSVVAGTDLVRLRPDLAGPPGRDLRLVFHRALRRVPRVRVVVDWLREVAAEFLQAG